MGRIALNLAVAALPAAAFVLWARRKTTIPTSGYYRAFLYGLLAVFPALLVMLPVSARLAGIAGLGGDALRAFIVAGLIEETVKAFPARLSSRQSVWNREDRAAVAATTGIGFAFMENAFYLVGSSSLLIARGILAVPLHAATAVYLGLAGRETAAGGRALRDVPAAILLATVVHGGYDLAAKRLPAVAPLVVAAAVLLAARFAVAHPRHGGDRSGNR